ncbi:uncharacterized protein scimp [Nelusetta ayraudi]|uniref:uncharacterized protein scimp n=1 Tax=Nelusetta ayraudi TaxID=303726 RepID=UPI003F7055C6
MDAVRKYLWLWVIVAIIFSSAIISLIFLLISKCISRRATRKHRLSQLQKGSDFNVISNKYLSRLDEETPPLPPRTQILLKEAKSFGNLAEAIDQDQVSHDYEQETHDYEQDGNDYEEIPDSKEETHDYEEETHDYEEETHDYEVETHDYEEETHDYEEETPDCEQDVHDYEESIPDYVEVEEEQILPPPPLPTMCPDLAEDNTSTEDYDDIGGEDEIQSEEDYDDVE